ncbi:formyltransferase family protein [Egicoccus sp. AB-alg2]|uniref:formyltransferase family protein n=1 Tax=Egicoccus sp. AB-alg2 TaxID=3242693 RepID=UPI00359D015F
MTRVVVVTNGNAFAKLFLAPTLRRFADRVAAVYVVTGIRSDAGRVRSIWRYVRRSGVRYVGYKAFTYLLPLLARASGRLPEPFVPQLAASLGIPVRYVTTPDAPELLDTLRAGPSLLVSVSCPMRVPVEVLEAASAGAVNVHSSQLPADAGLAPYVWVLAQGRRATGVSVHVMEERFDTGAILRAPVVPITPRMSVLALFLRQAAVGGPALADVVGHTLAQGRLPAGAPQDHRARSYHGMPTRAAMRDLRANGHRLVRRGDVGDYLGALRADEAPAEPTAAAASA